MAESKPIPVPTLHSKPYWDATKKRVLTIQRCADCHHYIFYPRRICNYCRSDNLEWKPVSGKGKIYTYSVVHRPVSKAFASEVPYVVAIVELDEGARMMANVVECDPEKLQINDRVSVVFDPVSDDLSLPKFKPVDNEKGD